MSGIWPTRSLARSTRSKSAVPLHRIPLLFGHRCDRLSNLPAAVARPFAAGRLLFVLLQLESSHGRGLVADHDAVLFHRSAIASAAGPGRRICLDLCNRLGADSVSCVFQGTTLTQFAWQCTDSSRGFLLHISVDQLSGRCLLAKASLCPPVRPFSR